MMNHMFDFKSKLFRSMGDGGGDMGSTGSVGGGEAQAEGQATTADGEEQQLSREEAFERYFAENKDLFESKMRGQLDRRFKAARETQARLDKAEPLLTMIADRYGVDAQDLDKLLAAVEADDSIYEEEAIRRGMDVEEVKSDKRKDRLITQLQAENQRYRNEYEEAAKQKAIDERNAKIAQSAMQTKQKYSAFNLENELKNDQFAQLLLHGVDCTTAYEVIHKDELLSGAIGYAAQRAAKATAESIAQRAKRPAENGTHGQAATQSKAKSPSQMTRGEIEDLTRRALAGERITLT
jgi:hypothetical protein